MTDFHIISDHSAWLPAFEERERSPLRRAGLREEAVTTRVERTLKAAAEATVAEITEAGEVLGYVAVRLEPQASGNPTGQIFEVWVRPGAEGHRPAAREWAERWCVEQGVSRIRVRTSSADELYAHWAVGGQTRLRRADRTPEHLTARPLTEAEYGEWLAIEKAGYVANMVDTGTWTEAEARSKSDQDFAELLPEGLATAGHTLLMLLAEGEPVGSAWLHHGHLPGVTYGYSLHVQPEFRGKGYGRDAMAVGEQATRAGGDEMMMFNVFGANTVAISLYESAGYTVLDEVRSFEL
ncbi:GNAT family N-acetyltransferase [Kitasatospora sp. NPDC002227]|uniref:GNAT family N-acetyltransferase n=1 Tax=Kitasatospora sp. NPDC002227 TaxID=3154773 RepID=UPI003318C877